MNGRVLFKLLKPLIFLTNLLFHFFPKFLIEYLWIISDLLPNKLMIGVKYLCAKRLLKSIGDNVSFGRSVTIKNCENISIGCNVSIHDNCYIDGLGGINIGDNVSIAHASSILSFDHSWSDLKLPIKYNRLIVNNIVIETDVWVGCGVRILAGSFLCKRVVIAANSVVKGKIESNYLYAGVPVKKIKPLD
jgi:acetyltransferase-like isoleucine patch superfamily enzyme